MSLIGDALKRARADSATGSGLPPNVFAVPTTRRSNLPWIVAAAATSLAIGVLVGAALFYRAIPSASLPSELPPSSSRDAEVVESAPGDGASPEGAPAATDGATPSVAAGVSRVASSPGPGESSQESNSTVLGAAVSQPGSVGDDPASSPRISGDPSTQATPSDPDETVREAAPTRPAAAPGRDVAAARDGEAFVRQVRLSDGGTLNLAGIVWSDANPAALINGEVYSVGEGVGPWKVAEVQRGEVTIEADGLRFRLRLK